jgi:hypothetical protein
MKAMPMNRFSWWDEDVKVLVGLIRQDEARFAAIKNQPKADQLMSLLQGPLCQIDFEETAVVETLEPFTQLLSGVDMSGRNWAERTTCGFRVENPFFTSTCLRELLAA